MFLTAQQCLKNSSPACRLDKTQACKTAAALIADALLITVFIIGILSLPQIGILQTITPYLGHILISASLLLSITIPMLIAIKRCCSKQNNAHLKTQEYKEQISKLQAEIEQLLAEKSNSASDVSDSEALNGALKHKEKEIKQLKQQLNQLEETLQNQQKELQKQIDGLEQEKLEIELTISNQTQQAKDLLLKIQNLEEQLQSSDNSHTEIQELEKLQAQLKATILLKNEEIKKLQKTEADLEQHIREQEATFQDLISRHTEQKNSSNAKLLEQEQAIKDLEDAQKQHQQTLNHLNDDLASAKAIRTKLENDNAEMLARITTLEEKITDYTQKLELANKEISDLKKQYKSLESSSHSLKNTLSLKDRNISNLEKELFSLKQQITQLKLEKLQLESDIRKLKYEVESLKASLEREKRRTARAEQSYKETLDKLREEQLRNSQRSSGSQQRTHSTPSQSRPTKTDRVLLAEQQTKDSLRRRQKLTEREFLSTEHEQAVRRSLERFFKVLGLPLTASEQEIRTAKIQLLKKHHTDKNSDPASLVIAKSVTEAATELQKLFYLS